MKGRFRDDFCEVRRRIKIVRLRIRRKVKIEFTVREVYRKTPSIKGRGCDVGRE